MTVAVIESFDRLNHRKLNFWDSPFASGTVRAAKRLFRKEISAGNFLPE